MKTFQHPSRPWSHFIKKTRTFFEERGFLEVFTPCLVPAGAFENAIDTLKVQGIRESCELHSSPEMAMKRVLAQEQCSIYQICHSFRDDPDTSIHFKEFNILEFYRPNADYLDTRQDIKNLLSFLSPKPLEFVEASVESLFEERLHFKLADYPDPQELKKRAEATGMRDLSSSDSWEDIFFRIFIEKIEPALPPETPFLIYDYPASVSTLAHPKGFWGERFELFWKGMELCNGATELTSSELLKSRFEFESRSRLKSGKAPHPFPHEFLNSLPHLPKCSGVAVGLDRLFWSLQT